MNSIILLNDKDGVRKEEMSVISGQKPYSNKNSGGDVWQNFYDKLKDIKDYHKKNGTNDLIYTHPDEEFYLKNAFQPPYQPRITINNLANFSGDELDGKGIDLHKNYIEFCNFKPFKGCEEYKVGDYWWYLNNFEKFLV